MSTTQKLFNLAFHPSTNESEAINAFLALRRTDNIQDFVQGKNLTSSEKFEIVVTYNVTLPPKSYDSFFFALNTYNDIVVDSEEPVFRLKVTKERKFAYDPYYLELKVFLKNTEEQLAFDKYLEGIFKVLKKY